MVEMRRVDPKKQLVNHIKEIDSRVKEVENKPSGNIVIRETVTATDPATGVSTVLGVLPNGSTGLQQWIGDTLPPDQPSAPIGLENLGVITVEWDGLTLTGEQQPPDYFRTVVQMSAAVSGPWIEKDSLYGRGVAVIVGEPAGIQKFFRLVSEDQNRNQSLPSTIITETPTSIADDPDLLAVIAESSNGKNIIIYQATQPTGTNFTVGDTWFKRASPTAVITGHYSWSGTAWVEQKLNHQVIASVDLGKATVGFLDGIYIKARTITADLLVTNLILTSKIIAGNPNGTHAAMEPTGFRVYANDIIDGIPNEVVRLGVATTDDYFAITRADGSLAATISQDGVGSFTQVNATNSFYYKGDELTKLLDKRPRGIITSAYRTNNSAVNAYSGGPYLPYLRVEATLEANRLYRFMTSSIRIDTDLNTTGTVAAGFAPAGQIATSSNVSLFTLGHASPSTGKGTVTLNELWAFPGATGETRTYSFILLFGVTLGSGQTGIRADGSNPVRMIIEDMGYPLAGGNGAWMDGTAPPPPPVVTYYKQYGCYNSMNYDGNGNQYNYNLGQMYQGLSPAGYGNLKSIGLFGNMTNDLAGSSVNYVRVYFNFNHWYYNSGGTARIGLHGHTGIPGTFWGNLGIVAVSGGWPKPGARWVDLPGSVIDGFRTGAYTGVYLEGDGGYGTYGYSDRPTIEISYTR